MHDTRIANGLKLHHIKTKVETLPVLHEGELMKSLQGLFKDDGYITAYLDYAVLMGYFRDGKCIFHEHGEIEEKYLLRLRLFNESKELYLWRSPEGFKARLRIDGEGEESPVIDAHQVLWGTRAKPIGEFTELTEDRGTRLVVPLKDLYIDDKKKRLFIRTRNYIGYTQNHQATYIDCRFIGFSD
jgi:CRISPR-associated protein (TIGR03984 family)